MLKALLAIGRVFVTVPAFEFVGAGLVIAGVAVMTCLGWTLIAAGGLAFLKSLDLATQGK